MGDKRLKRQLVTERKAFTLIELLVVIAVTALLMAVLLPVVRNARRQAQAVVCQAKLRQWGIGFSAYAGDHDGRMPEYYVETPRLVENRFWSRSPWFLSLEAYTTDYEDMLLCPTTKRRWVGPSFNPWSYHHPQRPYFSSHIDGSYGYNGWLSAWSHDHVAGHAGIPVVFDCRVPHVDPRHTHDPPEYEGHFRRDARWDMRYVCLNRHNGGINMLFRDWSVRKVGLKELWTLKWQPEFDTSGPWTLAGGVQPEDWPEWMRRFKEY